MDESPLSTLDRLAKCLGEASDYINQLADAAELENIRAQLRSLQVILDRNREALRVRIADYEQGGNRFPMRRSARNSPSE